MSSELREFVLGDICRFTAGSAFSPDEQGTRAGQYPFIKVSDLNLPGNEVFIRTANNYVTEAQRLRMKAKLHPADSTVFAKIGVALTSNRRRLLSVPTIIDNNMMSASAIQDFVRPRFLYYLLKTLDFNTIAAGTALPYLNVSDLQKIPVAIPCLESQSEIESVLVAVDDRITLLRETNATLEAIAQALFKSWFVDFDPVRAKLAGRAPEGMDEATAALFPGALEETELGVVPKGWSQRPVYEAAEFINGAAYKAFNPNLERRGLPIIKIAELKAGVTSQTAYSDAEMPSKYLIETADILFSWSGNPDTSIDTFVWAHAPAWLNQHIFRVIPQQKSDRAYLLQMLRYLKPVFAELARNKQTTGLGHVTVADLKRLTFVWPDGGVMKAFDEVVGQIQQRILTNEQQVISLAALRDALLPRLISGQLRLPEPQAQLEAAA